MKKNIYLFIIPSIICLSYYAKAQNQVTYSSLLKEMINLERLTDTSDMEYKSIQYSSYDRTSTFPDKQGWFSNSDGFGGESIPGFVEVLREPDKNGIGEYLMCDIQQPGAIVRLWTARINGDVKVFIDDTNNPLFEGSAEDFFWRTPEVLTGETVKEGITRQFDGVYFPISFSKRLRIERTGDLQKLHFYHIGLKLYDKTVDVEAFSKKVFLDCYQQFKDVLVALDNTKIQISDEIQFSEFYIPEQSKVTIHNLEGEGAIESFYIKASASEIENALRKCVLRIYFDGFLTPQVQSPLGDFFCSAPGINPYTSLPFSVGEDGMMVCRFIMPYKESAKIELENYSINSGLKIESGIKSMNYSWIEGKSMHFRARWKIRHDLTASNSEIFDFPYLMAIGKGRIVGTATFINNPSNIPTPHGSWWGEGDEKIFDDDDIFPSFF